MRKLVLYGRPGCHLCDDARELLRPLIAEAGDVTLEEVDIETDEALLARYLERIPVVELDGRLVSELEPDTAGLSAVLLQTSAR